MFFLVIDAIFALINNQPMGIIKKIVYPILLATILVACSSTNASQVMATMSGLQAGATLGGAIGGMTSRSHRGYFRGTTIGAISGAAIAAISTAPRKPRAERDDNYSQYNDSPRRSKKKPATKYPSALSGLRSDVRVTNVVFRDASGDAVLQPGESATLSYDVINVTPNVIPLLLPRMELERNASHIHISPMQGITHLQPGEGVRYSVTLTADRKVKGGDTQVLFYLSSDNGATYTAMNTFQFRTKK